MAAAVADTREARRDALVSAAQADPYPEQVRHLVAALAPDRLVAGSPGWRARGLLHLVSDPPPGGRERLREAVVDGVDLPAAFEAYLHQLGPARRWPARARGTAEERDALDEAELASRWTLLRDVAARL